MLMLHLMGEKIFYNKINAALFATKFSMDDFNSIYVHIFLRVFSLTHSNAFHSLKRI